ncbi:MAG: hypothetical protein KME65_04640 [Candidatus Thiodiazotropha sp. (ex Ctena orbiculata)]|uniref:Uncharacterized protein n=1 Tax=Candidatus Thiodiazotropha taylori TaxID=2792791 RepID=A0A944M6R5_9GAMM|nr:hypothetical protein [Candidatus Thiodiazotropha taylori]MBV2136374.1 hypothetical protein [Candidatus Thiodiazotropha taylori]PVV15766.1 MAG: hypothetical protein B6D82_02705 [gamma proteobacterium symbiont of Ctena orbiculata]
MKDKLIQLKQLSTVKLLVTVITIGSLFLLQTSYWAFETAYFGYFGVSPEIFNRPVFSSGFISVWFFAYSIKPILIIWLVIFVINVIVLTGYQFQNLQFKEQQVLDRNEPSPDEKNEKDCDNSQNRKLLSNNYFTNLYTALFKSLDIPIAIFGVGLFVLMVVVSFLVYVDDSGRELAKKQFSKYQKHECIDVFNNNNTGCYSIDGFEGKDHLILTNNKSHLIYLSRNNTAVTSEKETDDLPNIKLNIIEKADDEVFKIKREYLPKMVN